ncbi:TonB-dependent receptor [Bdellovibrionales bacterium]|nr:TonB-dependent receptor [Bdellovibrionales bacterium]
MNSNLSSRKINFYEIYKRASLATVTSAFIFCAYNSYGQSSASTSIDETSIKIEQPKNSKRESEEPVEKLKVTGSHIKRIDIEGPSPILVIDRDDLDRTGYNSVSDVLRDTTVNSFGSARERSGSNAAGVAHVNLRGMGSAHTLVLLNGKRLPVDAVTGAVDLNLIPMAAVERIEILKDGASAIYGSDALGGVVNIITRRDYDGTEVSMKQTKTALEGGEKLDISLVNGFRFGKLNMVNVIHHRSNDPIFSRDRPWSNSGVSTISNFAAAREIHPDGTQGDWVVDPNCPEGERKSTPSGDLCTFKYSSHSTSLPELKQTSIMSEATIDLNESTQVKLRGAYIQKDSSWIYAPAPDIFTMAAGIGTRPPGVDPGREMLVRYRLEELGNRVSEIKTDSHNLLLGVTKEVGESWEIEFSGGYNRVHKKDEGVSGYALKSTLNSLIASGQYDPFGPRGSRGDISSAAYVPVEKTISEITSIDLVASGEIGELSAGPMALAVGTSANHQKYVDEFDDASVNDEVFGSAGSSGGGERDVYSLFSELSVPMTTKLEIQLAARVDEYSDFGNTFNPKLAFKYQAFSKLLIRASAGSGFKAPNMTDLYAASSLGYPTFIDAVACKAEREAGGETDSCLPAQYEVTSSGNKGLEEERSINFNMGMVLQTSKDHSLGLDFWLTKLDNVVGLDLEKAMEAEASGADLSQFGMIVQRDSKGYIDSIKAPLQNLSQREVFGIDFTEELKHKRYRVRIEHSYLVYYKEEGFPGTGFKNTLNENGRPGWRNNITLGVSPTDNQDLSFSIKTIASHEKSVKEMGNLRQYTDVDLQYKSDFGKSGVLTVGIKNLLGSTPPLDNSNPNKQLDSSLYSQLGRLAYMGYKANF